MVSINLVDWRSQKTLILNRRFVFIMSAAIAVWLVLAVFIYLIILGQIGAAKSDVDYLDAQLNSVASELEEIKGLQAQKDTLLSKRKTIETLQASRPLVVKIFDNLARAMPDGVVLGGMARKGDEIILSGGGDSNYSISVLMENIQRLPWVKAAKIGEIKNNEGGAGVGTGTTTDTKANQTNTKVTGNISFTLNVTIDTTVGTTDKSGVQNATT